MNSLTTTSQKTVKDIHQVQVRLRESRSQTELMIKDLSDHKNEITRVEEDIKERWFRSTPNNEQLFGLIKSDQKSNAKTTKSISKLIKSINSNTEDLSKMIQGISTLLTMSYEQLRDCDHEIKNLYGTQSKTNIDIGQDKERMKNLVNLVLSKAKKEDEFKNYIEDLVQGHKENIESTSKLLEEFQDRLEQIHFAKSLSEQLEQEKSSFIEQKEFMKTMNQKLLKKTYYSSRVSIGAIITSIILSALFVLDKINMF